MTSKWLSRLSINLFMWCLVFFSILAYFLATEIHATLYLNNGSAFWQSSNQPQERLGLLVMAVTLLMVIVYVGFFACLDLRKRLGFVPLFLFIQAILTILFLLANVLAPHYGLLAGCILCLISFVSTDIFYVKVRREYRLMGIY